jgi:hypothetical protein
MRPNLLLAGVVLAAGLPASSVQAQSQELAGILLSFFSQDNPLVLVANPNPAFSHAAHFRSQEAAQGVLRQLNAGIASQVSTFPIGSSSAGFTYTFDEGLGVYNRTTESLGPIFTERPLTAGKGKFTFGVNYQNATYDSFEGKNLQGGGLKLFLTHEDTNNNATPLNLWFEGDLISATLRVNIESKTTVAYANYGVTERFDVSVAVPHQDVSLSANFDLGIERVATGAASTIHQFEGGAITSTQSASGSASGIGDILLRGKYNFLRTNQGRLAAFVDLRLPTGDEDNLLGSGATQTRLSLVAGGGDGRLSPRGAIGYTHSSGGSQFTGDLPNEIYYTAGFDLVLHPRVTLTADFIGRTLLDAQALKEREKTYSYTIAANNPTVFETTRPELFTETSNLSLMLGSAGIKINPAGRLLIVANVLFKLGDRGLQDKVTPAFGIGYTF